MSSRPAPHRYSDRLRRLLRPLASGDFWWRFGQLNLGLLLLGLGVALMLEAHIGLGPWPVFHEGLAAASGLSFGRVMQLTGLAVIALSVLLTRVRPGLGTVLNMLLVGIWVDLARAQPWLPEAHGPVWGVAQFVVAVTLVGLASGLYISAGLGAGPRDGLVLGLARLLRRSVRATRTGLELLVLVVGFALGGSVGLGTLLFALLIGPQMQFALWLFGRSERTAPRRHPAREAR